MAGCFLYLVLQREHAVWAFGNRMAGMDEGEILAFVIV
jgi:hypothetical protein